MTGLLVSVRSGREADEAVGAGAAVIDVKEPSRGSLGAANEQVWRRVAEVVAGRAPISVALGELLEQGVERRAEQVGRLSYAKLGLAGCATRSDWPQLWRRAAASLPASVALAAVVYADWQAAQAPCPEQVIDQAQQIGARALLVDTFQKTGRTLLDWLPYGPLSEVCGRARAAGMTLVLAGSLDRSTLPSVLPLQPDLIAVRGAVCRGGRTGPLDPRLVAEWAAMLAAHAFA